MAEQRTITVHAFGDERVHLAPAHLGRLRQGRLMTLCGRMAVTELSPFAAAAAASQRCRTCFGKVDDAGHVKTAPSKPAKIRPTAEVIDIATREPKAAQIQPAAKAKPAAKRATRKKPPGKAKPAGKGRDQA